MMRLWVTGTYAATIVSLVGVAARQSISLAVLMGAMAILSYFSPSFFSQPNIWPTCSQAAAIGILCGMACGAYPYVAPIVIGLMALSISAFIFRYSTHWKDLGIWH